MIRRYLPNETTYLHNKYVLSPIKAEVTEEANGMFELEVEVAKGVILDKGDILTAPTPRGEQPFRVYRTVKTLKGKRAYARHLFYDLASNFLVDVRPTQVNCDTAIKNILTASEVAHSFTGSSDIATLGTAYYIRKNPIEAIIGADNSVLNTWGGYLVRNGKDMQIKANGIDRGFEIRLGKNLIGIEDDSDESNVITKLYPTVEIDNVIKALPEKYVDSPQISNYPSPKIKEVRISLTDAEKELPLTDIYVLMRDYCNNLYSVDNIDKPVANYKIDFVQLGKVARIEQEVKYTYEGLEQLTYETIETLTYEQLEGVSTVEQFIDLLEQIDLYDLVNIRALDLNLKAMVISYRYDCLREKYINIELGGFKPSAKYQTANVIKQIQSNIENQASALLIATNYATEIITGNTGGCVITRKHPDGKPYEILIMDTDDINTATNVIRLNQMGLGFSQSGYNGPFGTAITIDGQINAQYIVANTLDVISANLGTITAGRIQDNTNGSYWDLNTGEVNLNVTSLKINSSDVATKTDLTDAVAQINNAKPNLVSNLGENWEQGDISSINGTLSSSLTRIRTRVFYTVRQGHVYIKVSPLYQAMIIVYNSNYSFKASYGFSTEQTFLLDENCYFKVVLQRTNGTAILPEAINTAELKVENSDVATQYTPYFGDLTLDAIQEYFVLDVQSNNGWTVDEPNFSATFTAKVFLFNEDVTIRFEPLQFTWYKQYPGSQLISLGNGTTVTVSGSSIEKSATISCGFEIYDTIYVLTTFNGNTILTVANDTIMVIGYQ